MIDIGRNNKNNNKIDNKTDNKTDNNIDNENNNKIDNKINNENNNKKDNKINNKFEKLEAKKRMPVWKLVITDILLTLICLGIFSLYHLVIPRHLTSNAVVVATVKDGEDSNFELPANRSFEEALEDITINTVEDVDISAYNNNSENANNSEKANNSANANNNENINVNNDSSSNEGSNNNQNIANNNETNIGFDLENSDVKVIENEKIVTANSEKDVNDTTKTEEPVEITNYGNSDTLEILGDTLEQEYISSADKYLTKINSYSSDNIQFITNRVEIGAGADKITYYISDVFVTNVKYLKTAFAKGDYGKNLKETTLEMAIDNNALLAINGDFYGNSEIGVVIRNGILYRTEVYDADICVLFTDGTLKTYSPEEFNVDQVLEDGAWQAWIFGPELIDEKGNVLTTFNSTYYLSKEHPRTAIGYVEPGHYVFVVADGRDLGYSRGVTLSELGQILADAGCVTAYNLDGGKSSAMAYGDAYVNQPYEGGRTISDIIYIGE